MNLRVFESLEDLSHAAARTVAQRLEPGVPAAVAISGGSTPRRLYELLGGEWRDELAKTPVTWVVVDERYVPPDDPRSNSAMIERTLFAGGISPSHRFLRFETELNDPERTAERFESQWRALGIDRLDIAILGCGEDGHTASLFPRTPVLDVDDRIAAAVFVPRLDERRVTITLPVIRAAKFRIVQAAGGAKANVIREVRDGVPHPVALATAGEGETWWFVDREASGRTL